MTTKLDRDAESFLAQVRGVDDPSVDDKQRVRAALAATIAAGTVATTAGTASAMKASLGAASAASGLFSLPKVVLGVALVLGGAGVFAITRNNAQPTAPQNANALNASRHELAPSAPAPVETRTQVEASPVPTLAAPAPVPSRESARVSSRRATATSALPSVANEAVRTPPQLFATPLVPDVEIPSTLREEMRLLREAQEAVRDGRPAEAIRLLDAHEQSFAGGVLANERAVLRTRATQLLSATQPVESDTSSNRSEH